MTRETCKLTEDEKQLRSILDEFIIDNCIKSFRNVSNKVSELFDYSDEYGGDLEKKLNNVFVSIKNNEIKTLKLQIRLEKILELVTLEKRNHKFEKKFYEKNKLKIENNSSKNLLNCNLSNINNSDDYERYYKDQKNLESSIDAFEPIINNIIKRSIEYNKLHTINNENNEDDIHQNATQFNEKQELNSDGEITVNITSDGSVRSLISKYIHGKKSYKKNGIETGNKIKDLNSRKREKLDNIKRTVKPLNSGENRHCSFWETICCISCNDSVKLGNYFKMTTQQWKDFLSAIKSERKSSENNSKSLERIDSLHEINGIYPLVVEYSSLNAEEKNDFIYLKEAPYSRPKSTFGSKNCESSHQINFDFKDRNNLAHYIGDVSQKYSVDKKQNYKSCIINDYQAKGIKMQNEVKLKQTIQAQVDKKK